MKQLIFVVETNKTALSDDRYIKKLVYNRYVVNDNDFMMQFVHMNGKGNYNNSTIISQINHFVRINKDDDNYVIYCFDTDRIDSNQEALYTFNSEKEYCERNNYDLIWFVYNIEYVLLGKNVEKNKKKQESVSFFKNKRSLIPTKRITSKGEPRVGYSNIYSVLDSYLKVKG